MRRRVAEDMRMARVILAQTADVSTSEHMIAFGGGCFWSVNSPQEGSLSQFSHCRTGDFWIQCDFCDTWYDGKCVQVRSIRPAASSCRQNFVEFL